MTSLEDRCTAMLDASSVVERAVDDVAAIAREHDAAALLRVARMVGATIRITERVRERIVIGARERPAREVGGDRPSFATLGAALGDRNTSTTYTRWERGLRSGAASYTPGPAQAAVSALTGEQWPDSVTDAELPVDQLVRAAEATWERRQLNSRDGAAVLAALAERIGWDDVAARTGIPVEVARAWGSPPAPPSEAGGER